MGKTDSQAALVFLRSLVGWAMQSPNNRLQFDFMICDDSQKADEIQSWLESQQIPYRDLGSMCDKTNLRNCRVVFEDPHQAMLFKLRFS